jgi:uncharacterized protein YndB with AHSA1/START domain
MDSKVPGIEPIEVAIDVDAPPADCYERFTAGFGEWWPTLTHSLSRHADTRCALEAREGGRLFETAPDGTEHVWGSITTIVPGERLRFSWHPGREADSAQWVEVSFERTGRGSRVTLTHGGWETLGEIAPILRREYVPGWQQVFGELFGAYARRRH